MHHYQNKGDLSQHFFQALMKWDVAASLRYHYKKNNGK